MAGKGERLRIAAVYSFNNGTKVVAEKYPKLIPEINAAIKAVNAQEHKTKESEEKTMLGKMLFSPSSINDAFKIEFAKFGWKSIRVTCDYPITFYLDDYKFKKLKRGAYREIDFVKERLGIEIQFGKYSFMVYNVCAKMTIFHNLNIIDHGVEIVPVKSFADEMSSGVSYFEQFVWDLESRGIADIDIPVMILGIDA
jgi:hypothetical protein